MHRIDSLNARADLFGVGKPGFHNNADQPGQDPTYLDPDHMNALQEEIARVVEDPVDGEPLDKFDNGQLLRVIKRLAASAAVASRFPVGAVAMLAVGTSPAVLFGYGTWTRICEGRFPLGYNSATPGVGLLSTGGAATHGHAVTVDAAGSHSHGGATQSHALTEAQLASHSHGGSTDAVGAHTHAGTATLPYLGSEGGPNATINGLDIRYLQGSTYPVANVSVAADGGHSHTVTTGAAGGGQGHSHGISDGGSHAHTASAGAGDNMPPWQVLAFWQRTA